MEFIGEDIDAEEGRLLDAALANSMSTQGVESMLRTQSAVTNPSRLGECFEGTWDPQL